MNNLQAYTLVGAQPLRGSVCFFRSDRPHAALWILLRCHTPYQSHVPQHCSASHCIAPASPHEVSTVPRSFVGTSAASPAGLWSCQQHRSRGYGHTVPPVRENQARRDRLCPRTIVFVPRAEEWLPLVHMLHWYTGTCS